VTVGAVIRLTRLITHDTITKPLRLAAARLDARQRLSGRQPRTGVSNPQPGTWQGFITCPWCVSMWMSAALFLLYALAPRHCQTDLGYVYAALTASWVTGTALASGTKE
jgi:hypothetical protein